MPRLSQSLQARARFCISLSAFYGPSAWANSAPLTGSRRSTWPPPSTDNGAGRLVTTEIRAAKAEAARKNLTRAGLIGAVDLRLGDARESLAEIEGLVDLAFLDGRNALYLDVLTRLEPRFSERAVMWRISARTILI